MKKVVIIAIALLAFSCKKQESEEFGKEVESEGTVSEGMPAETQTPEQLGETIFQGKGNCVSCHQVETKSIGPSIQEIAKIYKDKNANLITFLKGEGEPIVDPSQFEVMKANFVITKAMSDEELEGLEAYIYSNLK
jgi:cytochrome c